MKEQRRFNQEFYDSKAWKKVSRLYMASRNYVCERCGGVAVICHHKQYLTPANINNPDITLSFDNLECLCKDCHNKEHFMKNNKAVFDENGNMIGVKESAAMQDYRQAVKTLEHITGKEERQ